MTDPDPAGHADHDADHDGRPDSEAGGEVDAEDLEPLREDPETGSTPTDPAAERTGPYGTDPMGGEAPSG